MIKLRASNLAEVLLGIFLLMPVSASAAEVEGLEVHAFLSQGFMKTTDNNYLTASQGGSFNFTEVGLNFTKPLADGLRLGLQLYAQNLGSTDTFQERLDWAYFDYHWSDWLGIRFGRVKIPFGLYNDISDIDSARVPVLLPQSIYPIQNRDFLLAQSGVELYGYTGRGPAGGVEYRVYGGTIVIPNANTPWNIDQVTSLNNVAQVSALNTPYVLGGRVIWQTPLEGLRFGVSLQHLQLNSTLTLTGNPTPISLQIPANLSVGSLEYTNGDLLLAAEFSRWSADVQNSSNRAAAPDGTLNSDRTYVMGSYRLAPWLEPGVYDSVLIPDISNNSGQSSFQNDLSLTVRFDVDPYWLVKLEGHYMSGTGGLDPTLNNNTPLSQLASRWGVFLIKTTAYF